MFQCSNIKELPRAFRQTSSRQRTVAPKRIVSPKVGFCLHLQISFLNFVVKSKCFAGPYASPNKSRASPQPAQTAKKRTAETSPNTRMLQPKAKRARGGSAKDKALQAPSGARTPSQKAPPRLKEKCIGVAAAVLIDGDEETWLRCVWETDGVGVVANDEQLAHTNVCARQFLGECSYPLAPLETPLLYTSSNICTHACIV